MGEETNLPAFGLFVFWALWWGDRRMWRWWDWEKGSQEVRQKAAFHLNWSFCKSWELVISFWATRKWHLVRVTYSILILPEPEGLKTLAPVTTTSQPWLLLSSELELRDHSHMHSANIRPQTLSIHSLVSTCRTCKTRVITHTKLCSSLWDFEPTNDSGKHQRVVWKTLLLNLRTERYLVKVSHILLNILWTGNFSGRFFQAKEVTSNKSLFPSLSPKPGTFPEFHLLLKESHFDSNFHCHAWLPEVSSFSFKIQPRHKKSPFLSFPSCG